MFVFSHFDEPHPGGHLMIRRYNHGRLAVELHDEEGVYCRLSVNVPEVALAPDEFLFKNYSENQGLLEEMIRLGLVAPTGTTVAVNMVQAAVCKLTDLGRAEAK